MRILLSLSGTLPPPGELQQLPYDYVIAADGSAWQLLERGIMPNLIVGDLDSLHRIPQAATTFHTSSILHTPDQDSTDFEKALRAGIERGAQEFLIIGMNGGELEHTLNNWSIFLRYSTRTTLKIYDAQRIGQVVRTSLGFPSRPGELISLIPQLTARLTTRGLVWELSGELLEFGQREGARNQSCSEYVEILVEQGCVLVFCDAFAPWRPLQ